MFNRTDRVKKVMALANQEAQRFNHEFIKPEHILLALMKEGEGKGAYALKQFGITRKKLCLQAEKLIQSGPDTVLTGKIPESILAKKIIEYDAIEEARALNNNCIGTEHLLLALMREQDGAKTIAITIIERLGLSPEQIRDEILNVIGQTIEDIKPNIETKSSGVKCKIFQLIQKILLNTPRTDIIGPESIGDDQEVIANFLQKDKEYVGSSQSSVIISETQNPIVFTHIVLFYKDKDS